MGILGGTLSSGDSRNTEKWATFFIEYVCLVNKLTEVINDLPIFVIPFHLWRFAKMQPKSKGISKVKKNASGPRRTCKFEENQLRGPAPYPQGHGRLSSGQNVRVIKWRSKARQRKATQGTVAVPCGRSTRPWQTDLGQLVAGHSPRKANTF